MERFMEVSSNFMDSVDLQNGVFEEEGMKMLEKWETEGVSLLLGNEKNVILNKANNDDDVLDLDAPVARPEKAENHKINTYIFRINPVTKLITKTKKTMATV